jgi:hypothetical protein
MTVSGLTMSNAERQAVHDQDNQTHRHRSIVLRANRFGFSVRQSTVNWWRKAMFSACNAAWPRSPVRMELSVINISSSTAKERTSDSTQIQQFKWRYNFQEGQTHRGKLPVKYLYGIRDTVRKSLLLSEQEIDLAIRVLGLPDKS